MQSEQWDIIIVHIGYCYNVNITTFIIYHFMILLLMLRKHNLTQLDTQYKRLSVFFKSGYFKDAAQHS